MHREKRPDHAGHETPAGKRVWGGTRRSGRRVCRRWLESRPGARCLSSFKSTSIIAFVSNYLSYTC